MYLFECARGLSISGDHNDLMGKYCSLQTDMDDLISGLNDGI